MGLARGEHSFPVVRCPRNSECRSVVLKHMGWRTVADGRAEKRTLACVASIALIGPVSRANRA